MQRTFGQKLKDFLLFPLRAFTLLEGDRWGLSGIVTERFDYVSKEVRGFCLDMGCGRNNRFINEFLRGNGKGIDVFKYEGLSEEQILKDPTHFPFPDKTFDSATLIAGLNHVPKPIRDKELSEAYRCLKPGGNIIITMGNPLAEIIVHKVVWLHDKLFGTNYDMDSERGMAEEEEYYLIDTEIRDRLARAGFKNFSKKWFATQWGLNHLIIGWKK